MPTTLITLDGTKNKGASYHNINSGVQTFEFNFVNWSGTLKIQGTLLLDPVESDWFDIAIRAADTNLPVVFDRDSTDYDSTIIAVAKGNFVWVRAVIDTDSGSVSSILYNY